MNDFAKRLKEHRLKAGWTQAELGQKLGISTSAVGMYEQGRREPESRLLMDMSRLFGVSTDYLLGSDGGPKEVEDALATMRGRLLESGGLMFKGVALDEAETEKLFDAMLLAANLMLNDKKESEIEE